MLLTLVHNTTLVINFTQYIPGRCSPGLKPSRRGHSRLSLSLWAIFPSFSKMPTKAHKQMVRLMKKLACRKQGKQQTLQYQCDVRFRFHVIFSCRTESAAALGTTFLNLHLHLLNLHLHLHNLRDVSKLFDFAEATMLLCYYATMLCYYAKK